MAQTGSFGNITFEASDETVKTWAGLQRKLKARYATHQVANDKAKLEFLGVDLEEVTFRIRLDARFVSPKSEIEALKETLSSGTAHPLILGGRVLGEFVLQGFNESVTYTDKNGSTTVAYVDLTLMEYN